MHLVLSQVDHCVTGGLSINTTYLKIILYTITQGQETVIVTGYNQTIMCENLGQATMIPLL